MLAVGIVDHVDILVAANAFWDIDDASVGDNQSLCPVVPDRGVASQQNGLVLSQLEVLSKHLLHLGRNV